VLAHEAVESAVVIAVAMAQDQAVDFPGFDAEQPEVAVDDLGRVAEIEHVLRLRAFLDRCEMERQPPFRGESHVGPAGDAPNVLDAHLGVRGLGQKTLVARVDYDAHR
jgi:hypothetical protein